jgi:hypothetical protein
MRVSVLSGETWAAHQTHHFRLLPFRTAEIWAAARCEFRLCDRLEPEDAANCRLTAEANFAPGHVHPPQAGGVFPDYKKGWLDLRYSFVEPGEIQQTPDYKKGEKSKSGLLAWSPSEQQDAR